MTINLLTPRRFARNRLRKSPAEFREQLQQLGPMYIKVGQFLALRPDLISQEYSDELMRLLDRVPPFPWEQAREIIKADLHADLAELFSTINPRPFGSGSLAQIHVARLLDGSEVAVKVERPGVRAAVLQSLSSTRLLRQLLELSGSTAVAAPQEIIQELSDWILRELDFSNELANLTRLHKLAADSPFQKIPQPFPQLCGSHVITQEFLRGMSFSTLLQERARETRVPSERGWPNIDNDSLAANLITASLTQIFRYEFFHADLHPGNLLAMPDNVVGFVDFGLCDELDPTIRDRLTQYVAAVFSNDAEQMFSALTELLTPGPVVDMNAFRRDFLTEIRTPPRRGPPANVDAAVLLSDYERSPIAQAMIGVMRVAHWHHVGVPLRLLAMYRTLLTAETVAHQLGSNVDLRSVGRDFFTRLQVDQTLRSLQPDNLQSLGLTLLTLGRDGPGQVKQLLNELTDGRFTLNVAISEAPRITRNRNQRTSLIVSSVLSVGIALLLTRPTLPVVLGVSLAWPLLGLLIVLYLWIAIQWRRLR